jgi:hypothetical protein
MIELEILYHPVYLLTLLHLCAGQLLEHYVGTRQTRSNNKQLCFFIISIVFVSKVHDDRELRALSEYISTCSKRNNKVFVFIF